VSRTMSFDKASFPSFRPFLEVLEEYAKISGYRFKESDFNEEFEVIGPSINKVVKEYTDRIRAGDTDLLHEIGTASRLSEQEGIKNVMIATCKELKLWPPSTPDRLESIAYSDTSEPLDAIAWALFNHDQGVRETNYESHKQLLRTASFLVDYAHAIGSINLTETSKGGSQLLLEFLERAKEWTERHAPQKRKSIRDLVLEQVKEFADEEFVRDIEAWLDKHWEAVAVGGIALVVGFALAALALSSKNRH
jgi:hypothetical protein